MPDSMKLQQAPVEYQKLSSLRRDEGEACGVAMVDGEWSAIERLPPSPPTEEELREMDRIVRLNLIDSMDAVEF